MLGDYLLEYLNIFLLCAKSDLIRSEGHWDGSDLKLGKMDMFDRLGPILQCVECSPVDKQECSLLNVMCNQRESEVTETQKK